MVMYAQINVLHRIISLRGEPCDGLVAVDNANIINRPQDYKYVDGGFVLDAPPSAYHALNAQGDWYLNNEVLQNAKYAMWQQIKALRDERQLSGFNVGNYWFHSDDSSRIKYLGLLMMGANIPTTLMWKTMSGEFVQMTQTLAGQIFTGIAGFDSQSFVNAEQHKTAMQASANPLNYNYTTGWPPIFGE